MNYPATLIMTFEEDIRVPPFQSYKFAAALQNNPAQTNPILLRVGKDSGHYGSSNFDGRIEESGDMYNFVLQNLSK